MVLLTGHHAKDGSFFMRTMRRICAAILVALLALVILAPAAAWADDGDVTTVRVGYYEN